jgi:hypothetical protein
MARRVGLSAKTIKAIESRGQKVRGYRKSGEMRYREAEGQLTAAVEATNLPYLLALFKDYLEHDEFESLFEHIFLINALAGDVASSPGIPLKLHEFLMSVPLIAHYHRGARNAHCY